MERYRLLRWAQQAFERFAVVPPDTGICHQVNLEYLARVVFATDDGEAFPDTLVGTDSHTPMVNGLGVLGWGVGGIEAEAAMLGQPLSMPMPAVVGVELTGELGPATTATDLVLMMAELLRRHGVVGKFVEFTGPGLAALRAEHRATLGNMAPEYGATCAISPIDDGDPRLPAPDWASPAHVALVERYAKEQGLFHEPGGVLPAFSELSPSTCRPSSRASPGRRGPRTASRCRRRDGRFERPWLGLEPDADPRVPRRRRPGGTRAGRWEPRGSLGGVLPGERPSIGHGRRHRCGAPDPLLRGRRRLAEPSLAPSSYAFARPCRPG